MTERPTRDDPARADLLRENLRLGNVLLRLGFVTREQLAEALELQDELEANQILTRIGDVMADRGFIGEPERNAALEEQNRLLLEAGFRQASTRDTPVGWLVAAAIPGLCGAPVEAALAWGAALLCGTIPAAGRPARWVAIGWAASVAVPSTSLAAIASGGSLVRKWRVLLVAALLGTAFGVAPLPQELRGAGPFPIVSGCALAVVARFTATGRSAVVGEPGVAGVADGSTAGVGFPADGGSSAPGGSR